MKTNFYLVWRGLALAGVGFVATCCYILGLSEAYLGDFPRAGIQLGAAALLFFIFARRLRTYFTALDNHETTSHHND